MAQGTTPVLDEEVAATLKNGLNGHKKSPRCASRSCLEAGVYFLCRVTRGGKVRRGLYCEEHDNIYGRDNLKKQGGKVVVMVDVDGTFEGIITP